MNLANRITILRIVMVPVFIALLLYTSPERAYFHPLALTVFFLACLTDALDGYLARKLGEKTALGAYIDPIADKLLLLSGFLSLSLMSHLPGPMHMPAWVTIAVFSRDIVIVIGSFIVFFTTGALKPKPILLGKITTVVQMATLMSALGMAPLEVRYLFEGATVFFTFWSGVLYVHMGGKMLQEA